MWSLRDQHGVQISVFVKVNQKGCPVVNKHDFTGQPFSYWYCSSESAQPRHV